MIAGTIQVRHAVAVPHPERAIERRNTVLQAMADEEFISTEAPIASREPLQIVPRAVDNEAPYFVDMVVQQVRGRIPGLMAQSESRQRLHDARSQPAARGARRGPERAERVDELLVEAPAQGRIPRRRR